MDIHRSEDMGVYEVRCINVYCWVRCEKFGSNEKLVGKAR